MSQQPMLHSHICPRCGGTERNATLLRINHAPTTGSLCMSQLVALNHATIKEMAA